MFGGMRRARLFSAAALIAVTGVIAGLAPAAQAADWAHISGSGSTWAQNTLDRARRDIMGAAGMSVDYRGIGSTAGRADFVNGTVDFAVSELPFQTSPEYGGPPERPRGGYTYIPAAAGGTALAYNLRVDGRRFTDLRLSGRTIAGIFSGTIARWNDRAILADNPRVNLPDSAITPIVRADSSGSSASFSHWLSSEVGDVWTAGTSSIFPVPSNGVAQLGSLGASGYVAQNYGEGAITYVEKSYAMRAGLPTAKILNAAGYYVAPTAANVSVALLGAEIGADQTQILDAVYHNPDPRTYPLSSYAYLIAPTETGGIFTSDKGRSLAEFARHLLCENQQLADSLGNAPLPVNLVRAGLTQAARVPGADAANLDIDGCRNPTFRSGETSTSDNTLTQTAPYPPACDRLGADCVTTDGSLWLEASVLPATDGKLSLSVPTGATVVFDEPAIVDGRSVTTGSLPRFSVVDERHVSRPGYTVHSSVTDFISGSQNIPASALTVTPAVDAGSTASGVAAAPAFTGSSTGALFADAAPGGGIGTAVLTGGFRLTAPLDAEPGTYRARMTLTIVSR
ncbi:phosphate ABC transporter substrate-binding protein [Microbacterium sp. Gd 4-13]|uniref:phosphate ABC transporter substrate-binding protein PstS n=1 Tax=Microbacterium sp. Gd 4-13 TaxID=2173179 RepID=UPI000D56449E|nr:phosphate ABC transporter substrate-binding protein PstS [Microbacterium sp. Gd 4-13]PVW02322.1 phosphate ABC transporter substrate-binding protein [Microbacterium sp. Gd 4-13]